MYYQNFYLGGGGRGCGRIGGGGNSERCLKRNGSRGLLKHLSQDNLKERTEELFVWREAGVVDAVGGGGGRDNSERGFRWGGGWSLRDLSKNILI